MNEKVNYTQTQKNNHKYVIILKHLIIQPFS